MKNSINIVLDQDQNKSHVLNFGFPKSKLMKINLISFKLKNLYTFLCWNPLSILKLFNFINYTTVISFSYVNNYFLMPFEYVFVKILNWFNAKAYFDIDMIVICCQRIGIVMTTQQLSKVALCTSTWCLSSIYC